MDGAAQEHHQRHDAELQEQRLGEKRRAGRAVRRFIGLLPGGSYGLVEDVSKMRKMHPTSSMPIN
jgi:hypothetical protein